MADAPFEFHRQSIALRPGGQYGITPPDDRGTEGFREFPNKSGNALPMVAEGLGRRAWQHEASSPVRGALGNGAYNVARLQRGTVLMRAQGALRSAGFSRSWIQNPESRREGIAAGGSGRAAVHRRSGRTQLVGRRFLPPSATPERVCPFVAFVVDCIRLAAIRGLPVLSSFSIKPNS